MAFPLIPVALGGGVLGLFLLSRNKSGNNPVPNPSPSPKPSPGPGPHKPPVYPPGSGDAVILPAVGPGLRTRTGPGTNSPLVAPDGTAGLAYTGDNVAVIRTGVAATDGQGGEWWEVLTPGGYQGYSRAVDSAGTKNMNLLRAPTANGGNGDQPVVQVSGNGQFGLAYDQMGVKRNFAARYRMNGNRRLANPNVGPNAFARLPGNLRIGAESTNEGFATCAAPIGAWLRSAPDGNGHTLLPPGASVQVLDVQPGLKREATSSGQGGWARVRYQASNAAPVEGFVLSEWLEPAASPTDAVGRRYNPFGRRPFVVQRPQHRGWGR